MKIIEMIEIIKINGHSDVVDPGDYQFEVPAVARAKDTKVKLRGVPGETLIEVLLL